MAQVFEILPHGKQWLIYTMTVDVLTMQGARASTEMVSTSVSISVPWHHYGISFSSWHFSLHFLSIYWISNFIFFCVRFQSILQRSSILSNKADGAMTTFLKQVFNKHLEQCLLRVKISIQCDVIVTIFSQILTIDIQQFLMNDLFPLSPRGLLFACLDR